MNTAMGIEMEMVRRSRVGFLPPWCTGVELLRSPGKRKQLGVTSFITFSLGFGEFGDYLDHCMDVCILIYMHKSELVDNMYFFNLNQLG